MNAIFRVSTLALCLTVSACGGGGGESATPTPTPTPTPQPSGTLDIDVAGLPANTSASIVVSGPNSYSTTLDSSTVLDDLADGTYTVTVEAVSTAEGTFDSVPAEISVTVDGQAQLSVLYQTPVVSEGPIEGFGSVVINGTRFDSSDATVISGGETSNESVLDLGMVVEVIGRTTADGSVTTAQQISYYTAAEGPIEAISFSQNQFTVLGQQFLVNQETRFVDRQFAQLRIGDIVEVSAIGGENTLTATRVEYYTQLEGTYEVSGRLSDLNQSERSFRLGELTIDFRTADVDGTLSDNVMVSVESSAAPIDGILIADEVDVVRAERGAINPGKFAKEGMITQLNEDQIQLDNQQTYLLSDATVFVNGTVANLAVNARVMVRGTETSEGLIAQQVVIIPSSTVTVSGKVTELDNNEIRVYGTEFDVNSATQIVDMRSVPHQRILLDAISLGDSVLVKGFYDDDNDLTARRIELVNAADTATPGAGTGILEIEGTLDSFTLPTGSESGTLTVNGLTIDTSAATRFYWEDRFVYADTFFSELAVGDTIDVDASLLDGRILAFEVEKNQRRDNEKRRTFEIEGVISSSLNDGQFELAGLSILTDQNTRYDDGNESGLVAGEFVEVRAREDETGNVVAIYIDFESRDRDDNDDDNKRNEVEIEGRIANFNAGSQTFSIQGQQVKYSDATEVENGSLSDLANEVWVEVDGYLDASGTLVADYIYIEDNREDELEGTISQVLDGNRFIANGITVEITARTEFENGNLGDIQVGAYVEVEGVFLGGDRMRAWEIYFED